MNKYLAEFLGTFALALAVGVSLAGGFPVATPIIAALTLGICVYTFGETSGTHINPAITLALLSLGKISLVDSAGYLAAQFAAGGAAMVVQGLILHTHPAVTVNSGIGVLAAEALGTFWLAIGVSSVVLGKVPAPAAGLTIGGSLLIGISLAAPRSNGVLNPAVALGIGSFSVFYLIGPIIGAVIAMQINKHLISKDAKDVIVKERAASA